MWYTPVISWQYNWYFATHQIALATDEVCLCQFALSDDAGCFLMDSFKLYTSKLLLLSLSLFSLTSPNPHVMDNADMMPLVASNQKVCGKWNDLPSEIEFKLITYCYSPLDKQSIAQFGKTTGGESPLFPIICIAHIPRWGTWVLADFMATRCSAISHNR